MCVFLNLLHFSKHPIWPSIFYFVSQRCRGRACAASVNTGFHPTVQERELEWRCVLYVRCCFWSRSQKKPAERMTSSRFRGHTQKQGLDLSCRTRPGSTLPGPCFGAMQQQHVSAAASSNPNQEMIQRSKQHPYSATLHCKPLCAQHQDKHWRATSIEATRVGVAACLFFNDCLQKKQNQLTQHGGDLRHS